ncbi:FAD binding domain-containing protein [Syntrophomonas wolfei]|uniref:Medium FAD-binding subunit of molybdenum enzyme n=1 Tax=Syntrophomonas wolfei subsp. wolfei (strain DSM 2245B / Goettingen) TaxID=335541 RepID=Q0AVY7_SYNWW|nr:FAD binding domain-containing protein [Syntrophomonas wolfei]ABI69117.1 medium FAD-binding subunit of molybdenum enzyme [Syntrophomonas wolfei subsp. wolfei str. Goettingen G311]
MSQVFLPHTLDELWTIKQENPAALIMAGGTDLLVKIRDRKLPPAMILGLENIAELRQIERQDDEICIGSMVTHQQLLDSPIIQTQLPVLHQAVTVLGSPPIRHMGTIGGNICTASPAGDTLPPLYVLNAGLELKNAAAGRLLPIQDFIQGPGQTLLGSNEILYKIHIPIPAPHSQGFYFKVGQRKALAIAISSMASLLQLAEDNRILDGRFAWGSIGPTVMRFPEVENTLIGEKLSPIILGKLGQSMAALVSPISDVRASAEYRRLLASKLPLKIWQSLL